jgi:hypothetical protein
MKFKIICTILCLCQLGWAKNEHNPFLNKSKIKIRRNINLKYQYLGLIQNANQGWAFIKAVGGDIERVQKGQSIGIGRIVYFDIKKICMNRDKAIWCLLRSSQSVSWKIENGGMV